MSDQEPGPERLTPKGLPTARRGYDRDAVERLLEEARVAWAALQAEHRRLLAEIDRAGGLDYLARDLGAVGTEVGRLLADAQEAALGMRRRAQADSAQRLEAAAAEAQRLVSEAEAQAFELRADAWATGTELLRQAAETGRSMMEDAEAEVLIIRAGAEQEAYRLVASARRESQDLLREARFAAERAAQEARAQAVYLEPPAAPSAPARGESAPPEQREPGRRRHRSSEAPVVSSPDVIRVIQPDPGGRPIARPGIDPGSYGDALAAEVEALRESGEVEVIPVIPEPLPSAVLEPPAAVAGEAAAPVETVSAAPEVPAEAPPGEPGAEAAPEQPTGPGPVEATSAEAVARKVILREPVSAAEQAPAEATSGAPAGEEATAPDEGGGPVPPSALPVGEESAEGGHGPGGVEELFARLRDTHRPAGRRRRGAPAVGETLPGLGEAAAPTLSTARGPVPDAIELRERLVLAVQNRALRRVKENLLELQNSALDSLRVAGTWEGREPALAALAPALDPVAEEAAEAGAQAAAAFTDGEPPAPVISSRSATLVQEMADELAGQVAAALAEGAEAGPLELAARVSRVFRAWRGEEAEHWVRTVAYAAYHDSLLAGLALAGVQSVSPVAHGLLCAECPALRGGAWNPAGDPPPGTVLPPAHPDCVCTVAPSASP